MKRTLAFLLALLTAAQMALPVCAASPGSPGPYTADVYAKYTGTAQWDSSPLEHGAATVVTAQGHAISVEEAPADAVTLRVYSIPTTDAQAVSWMEGCLGNACTLLEAFDICFEDIAGNRIPADGIWFSLSSAESADTLVSLDSAGNKADLDWTLQDGTYRFLSDGNPYILLAAKTAPEAPDAAITLTAPADSLLAGGKLKLEASAPAATAIVWSLAEGDGDYASISTSGVLTASKVTERHVVTVYARAKDGSAAEASLSIPIIPKAASMQILHEGLNVTGQTLQLDQNSQTPALDLTALIQPADAGDTVRWKSSNPKVATVDPTSGRVTPCKDGTVTITAATEDGSRVSASVKVKVVTLASGIAIVSSLTAPAVTELFSGKSAAFKVKDTAANKLLANNALVWELPEEYQGLASLSAAGRLSVKPIHNQQKIKIYASLLNKEDVRAELDITLYPFVSQVQILQGGTPVNGKTLPLDLTQESLQLDGTLYPSDSQQTLLWKSSNPKIASVDPASGLVEPVKAGTVTITATAQDGSRKSASVKVQVGNMVECITINGPKTVASGSRIALTALLTAAGPNLPPTNKKLNWSVDNPAAASISSGRLTAKTVYSDTPVRVTVTSQDAQAVSASYDVTVTPKHSNTLSIQADGQDVTAQTLTRKAGGQLTLTALNSGGEPITWKSSKPAIAAVPDTAQDSVNVTFLSTGSVTFTATSADRRTAKVTVKVANLVSDITVQLKKEGAPIVASGKALALTAAVSPAKASRSVTWSIVQGQEYARISASGSLTANKELTKQQTVKVVATAKDGSLVQSEPFCVTVYPIATGISLMDAEGVVKTGTTKVLDLRSETTLPMSATVYPYTPSDPQACAWDGVTWTSSNPKIASVDPSTGLITAHRAGKVTITCKANDGSSKTGKFQLQVLQTMQELTLTGPTVLAGGKSLRLGAAIAPSTTTNKKLLWTLSGDTAYATISSNGTLKAKAVTAPKKVVITATAQDGGGVQAQHTVILYPAATAVRILHEGAVLGSRQTITLRIGESLHFTAQNSPLRSYQGWEWKISKAAPADLKSDGNRGAIVTGKKAGTITLTATAADGSGKKATVNIKIVP